jgi:hypothetical protein
MLDKKPSDHHLTADSGQQNSGQRTDATVTKFTFGLHAISVAESATELRRVKRDCVTSVNQSALDPDLDCDTTTMTPP